MGGLKARSRAKAGKVEEAVSLYEELVARYPDELLLRVEFVNAILRRTSAGPAPAPWQTTASRPQKR